MCAITQECQWCKETFFRRVSWQKFCRKSCSIKAKRASNIAYQEANREEIREQQKTYRQDHRDEISARMRAYYQDNREDILSKKHEYGVNNREEIRARNRSHARRQAAREELRDVMLALPEIEKMILTTGDDQ